MKEILQFKTRTEIQQDIEYIKNKNIKYCSLYNVPNSVMICVDGNFVYKNSEIYDSMGITNNNAPICIDRYFEQFIRMSEYIYVINSSNYFATESGNNFIYFYSSILVFIESSFKGLNMSVHVLKQNDCQDYLEERNNSEDVYVLGSL